MNVLKPFFLIALLLQLLLLVALHRYIQGENSINGNKNETVETIDQRSVPILFVIFAGGKSGLADLHAILDTWGQKVDNALVLSNTLESLPVERLPERGKWRIRTLMSLQAGADREAATYWSELTTILRQELANDPNIQWVIRSDSDTWWNVAYLQTVLGNEELSSATEREGIILGQAYGLHGKQRNKPIFPFTSSITDLSSPLDQNGVYLSGGAGVLISRGAVESFDDCLRDHRHLKRCGGREDLWICCEASTCGVTIRHQPGMFQRPDQVGSNQISEVLAIHRAVGDGRGGYGSAVWEHPSYYEDQLT